MILSKLTQSIQSIDYDWKKPQTYLVFIPGLSLLIQKVQMAHILPLSNEEVTGENAARLNAQTKRFVQICKWHYGGSMTQLIIAIIASKILLASPFAPFFVLLTTYEFLDTWIKGLRNGIHVTEFYPDGRVKRLVFGNVWSLL